MQRRALLGAAAAAPLLSFLPSSAAADGAGAGVGASKSGGLPPLLDEADVVVVGSGFAGLSAAIEARKAGASVLVIEKMPGLGGNSALCAGDMAVPGSPVQKALGITGDSPARMEADLMATGPGRSREHARAVAEGALATWRWTGQELGVAWRTDRIQADWGQSVPRGITLESRSGFSIVKAEVDALERLKARIRTGCRMERLAFSGPRGRAVGVIVRVAEKGGWSGERFVRARRGVVLAYGGFSADVAFRTKLNPLLGRNVATSNQPGATSEAWRAMIAAGADVMDLESLQVMCWNSGDERGLGQAWTFIEYATVPAGQWFDAVTGEALLGADRSPRARTALVLARAKAGHEVIAAVTVGGAKKSHMDERLLGDLLAQGIIAKRSPEGFARRIHSEAGAVRRALSVSGAENGAAGEILSVTVVPKVHHSQGGLRIDGLARAQWKGGGVMKGVYAAGEATGGLFGERGRIPSHSVTDALVMGRIAGRSAARMR